MSDQLWLENAYDKNEADRVVLVVSLKASNGNETIEEIKQRARQFILEILEWQRIQTAGNSLEPSLPLTFGNVCEELV